jgi:hypothetical protein
MKKKILSVIGFALICRFHAFSQVKPDTSITSKQGYAISHTPPRKDSSSYNPRKLHIDEIDLVSSYYHQNGDHSAVTGGIGTEKVTDLANGITINLIWLNKAMNKNTLQAGLGFDYHTSASQAFVSKTGASSPSGTRIYPSLDWTVENAKKGNSFGAGASLSNEYNYKSVGANLHFSQKTADKNGEFTAKLQGYFDQVTLIYPSELDPNAALITQNFGNGSGDKGGHRDNNGTSPRTTLSASFSYSQQLSSRLQVMFLGDVVTQNGYLGLPFHRVYFTDGTDAIEKLPSSRFKIPVGLRLNYFLGDNIIIRSYYRYYTDNWGSKSNTAGLEVPVKVTPFFSISPFYRYYNQSAARYFAPYEVHSTADQYYTSNYEYAKFQSSFYGIGFRIAPPAGVFGWQGLHELEIRYGHYTQTTDLISDVVSVSLGFK